MLAAGIPQAFWKGLAAELKFDVKLVAITLKEKATEETRYSKVELVERYLFDEGEIGAIFDIGEPSKFFWGKLGMQWGPYVHHTAGDYRPDWPMVWFGGRTEEAIVGLAGSRRHLIGETEWTVPDNVLRETPAFTSYSEAYAIVDALRAAETQDDEWIEPSKKTLPLVADTTLAALGAGQNVGVPPVTVEFLAHRLIEGEVSGTHVVLGSPLFVAS